MILKDRIFPRFMDVLFNMTIACGLESCLSFESSGANITQGKQKPPLHACQKTTQGNPSNKDS